MSKTILLLGGTGNTGRLMAQYLLGYSDVKIVIAGRNELRAKETADRLNQKSPGRISAKKVDAGSSEELIHALDGVNLLAVASSTSQYAEIAARACLATGVDYFDVQYSAHKLKTLNKLKDEIDEEGLCFVTDGGFHPGLPAVMIRAAAEGMDQITSAVVGSVIKIDWAQLTFADSTIKEFAEEIIHYEMLIFKDKAWKQVPMTGTSDFIQLDFGEPFNKQFCAPMFLEELRAIPEMLPSLERMGFFVGGFNPVVDNAILPVIYMLLKINPTWTGATGRLLEWGLRAFSRPPYGTLLKLEANGFKNGYPHRIEMLIAHKDGYELTAIPAAACILQMINERTRKTGLHYQALFVDPAQLFNDMEKMGVTIQRKNNAASK